jgi:hypothetical protein
MRVRPLDLVIVLAAAAAVAYSASLAYGPGKGRVQVAILGRDGEWVYPLSTDREVSIAGPLGDTRILIRGKSVRIEDSPCPNKTCVASGAISEPNQWIACLPNKVLVRIEGSGKDEGVDASVY